MAHLPASEALGAAFVMWAKRAFPIGDQENNAFAEAIMDFADRAIAVHERTALISENVTAIGVSVAAPNLTEDMGAKVVLSTASGDVVSVKPIGIKPPTP